MQLERDNVSSAGPLQSIASAFVRSFLVHAAGVFQTTHVDTIKQPQWTAINTVKARDNNKLNN